MSRQVTDTERTRIIEAIETGGTRNQIARDHHRSPGTITRIAKAAGLTFDRTHTEKATEARQADNRDRRTQLAETMLTKALRLAAAVPDTPPAVVSAADVKALVIASKVLLQGAIEAEQANRPDDEHSAVDMFITHLIGPAKDGTS